MKFFLKIAIVLLFAGAVAALPQEKTKPSDDLQIKIIRAQKHLSDLQIKAGAAKAAWDEATSDYTNTSKTLVELVDLAYKQAGITRETYDLNPETLEFSKKITPNKPVQ